MRCDSLTQAEERVVETFREQLRKDVDAAYHRALADVSGILTWLSSDPPLTIPQLAAYCLAEFERAGKANPQSAIRDRTDFYRKTFGELWPGCLDRIRGPDGEEPRPA